MSTGVWDNCWWEEPAWCDQVGLSPNEISKRVEIVKTKFPFVGIDVEPINTAKNFVISLTACGKSTSNLMLLLRLADALRAFEHSDGFLSVLKDLEIFGDASYSAFQVLDAAYSFFEEGFKVRFPVAKARHGKRPDIIVKGDEGEFAIECKYLLNPQKKIWCEEYENSLSHILLQYMSDKGADLEITLSRVDVDSYFENGEPKIGPREEALRLRDSIRGGLDTVISEGSFEQIGDISNGLIEKISSGVEEAGVLLHGYDERLLAKRSVSNGVRRANEQIDNFGVNGLAIVHSKEAWDFEWFAKEVGEFLSASSGKLLGVLITRDGNILSGPERPYLLLKDLGQSSAFADFIGALKKHWNPLVRNL